MGYDTRVEGDGIQHGIDDDPHNDAKKGAVLGGAGGAAVGAAAGSMAGPAGAVIGAVVGGLAGAAGSGAAVGAVDAVDNDNNVTGVGDDIAYKNETDPDGRNGSYANGAVDTRGAAERMADAATGDRYDDKTGRVVR